MQGKGIAGARSLGPDHASRGLVNLDRWNYCLSSHGVKNVRKLALGEEPQQKMRGVETKTGLNDVTTYS
jgi:hypothetical protein